MVRRRPDFPHTVLEFQQRFPTEEACEAHLAECRWPDGFVCPRCGGGKSWARTTRRLRECAACGYQVSTTAGTILHRTRAPLLVWFWAAYLLIIDKRGLSALGLQRQLGIARYETAWMILHKLRRATVNLDRSRLTRPGSAGSSPAVERADAPGRDAGPPSWCSRSRSVPAIRGGCGRGSCRTTPQPRSSASSRTWWR